MIVSFFNFLITFISEYGLWCFFGVIFIGGSFILFKEDKKGSLSRKVTIAAMATIITTAITYVFISYINPNYTCVGYSTNSFKVIKQEENVLACMNEIGYTGGKTMGHGIYRLQGLNLDDGKIIYRISCRRYDHVLGCQNQIVWLKSAYKELDVRGIDIKNGETKLTVDEDYLKGKFHELQSGVYSCEYNTETQLFDIVSKEAIHLSLNLLTGKKEDANLKITVPARYNVASNEITDVYQTTKAKMEVEHTRLHLDSIRDKQLQSNLTYAQLDAEYEKLPDNAYKQEGFISLRGEERQKLFNQKGEVLNNELSFLMGGFVLYDSLTQNSFIISYKTLDKIEFTLSCVSITGKLLWKAGKSDLHVGDIFNKNPEYTMAFIYHKKAIFVFEGFVLSLDKDTGSVNWLTRI